MKTALITIISCFLIGTAFATAAKSADKCQAGHRLGWKETDHHHSIGGKLQPKYNTLDVCEAECGKKSDCVAIDYDTKSHHPCWFLTKSNIDGGTFPLTNVNHFEFECCPIEWKEVKGQHHPEAVYEAKHTKLDDCKKACAASQTCYGIDFNKDAKLKKPCWFLSKKSLAKADKKTDVDSYLVEPKCPGASACTFTWKEEKGVHHPIGGAYEPKYRTLTDCKKACEKSHTCYGIDFNKNVKTKKPCWFLAKVSLAKTAKDKDVDGYVIERKCPAKKG